MTTLHPDVLHPRHPSRFLQTLATTLALAALLSTAACGPADTPEPTAGDDLAEAAETAEATPTVPDLDVPGDTDYPPLDWDLAWAEEAVFYEIFVRSFADSDGDGVGDLPGLTARLDYLNDGDPDTDHDLGITGIWLMPVFVSPSYHGYDVVDYREIDPDYGTTEDFQRFLAAAHERGIRVIVDLMINHTSSQHPWFENARIGPDAPLRDWYVWRQDDPGWTQPWGSHPTWHRNEDDGWYYYGIFWGGMPDLDFRNPDVRREVTDVADHWLGLGVDGYRLDAARHIVATGPGDQQNGTPQTHAWWREFAEHVHARDPSVLLVGEVWSGAEQIAPYFDELPMNFNFPLGEGMVQAVKTGRAAPVADALAAMEEHFPPFARSGTFLTNHDMERIGSQVAGSGAGSEAGTEADDDREARLRTAAALLFTLPGTPFVYYGEELGMKNGPGSEDEWKRTPMPWTGEEPGLGFTTAPKPWHPAAPGWKTANVEAQSPVPGSLLSRYRQLIRLRQGSAALTRGDVRMLEVEAPSVLAFTREAVGQGQEGVLVAHNLGGDAATATLPPVGAAGTALLWSDEGVAVEEADGRWRVVLPPWSSGVWRLE